MVKPKLGKPVPKENPLPYGMDQTIVQSGV